MSSKNKKGGFLFFGTVIDNDTGKKVHSTNSNNLDDFEEFFNKPMRKKLT